MSLKYPLAALALVLFFVSGCETVAVSRPHEKDATIEGVYELSGNRLTTLEITVEEDLFVAILSGGSSEEMGSAAPADCYVKALGKLMGKTLEAAYAPIETETFSYSTARAEQERRMLAITFGPGTAEVTRADTFGYCGMGAGFLGFYKRTTGTKQPSERP